MLRPRPDLRNVRGSREACVNDRSGSRDVARRSRHVDATWLRFRMSGVNLTRERDNKNLCM
jgi:uncharacterized protein YcbK (DUF882 family)